MEQLAEKYLAQVRILRRRARRALVLARLVQGAFAGCLAGAVLAALGGTIRFPVPAPLAAAAVAALGAAAGTLAGLLRHLDTRLLLIRADRALRSHELATTAWELTRPGGPDRAAANGGIFTKPIVEDAAALLAGAQGRGILGPLRLPLLPFVPILAALIAAASLFPFDLKGLFAAGRPDDREIAVLGEELEGLGRRIEAASRELDMGRGLELSRELAQLGRDLQDRSVEPGETLERVENLRRRLVEEYGLRLERFQPGQGRERIEGEGGEAGGESGTGDAPSEPGQSTAGKDARTADGKSPPADQGAKDLADAMKTLDELRDRASRQRPGETDPSRRQLSPLLVRQQALSQGSSVISTRGFS